MRRLHAEAPYPMEVERPDNTCTLLAGPIHAQRRQPPTEEGKKTNAVTNIRNGMHGHSCSSAFLCFVVSEGLPPHEVTT